MVVHACSFFLAQGQVVKGFEPPTWPEQFKCLLVRTRDIPEGSNSNQQVVSVDTLFYDWPNRRNLFIIREQGNPNNMYDLELGNGTSYYYTMGKSNATCDRKTFPVGILPPFWLKGATYLGRQEINGIVCDAWAKASFITYYASALNPWLPVRWIFHKDNMTQDVVRFHKGSKWSEDLWRIPKHCPRAA